MVEILWTQKFQQEFSHVKDSAMREKILKQIRKIHERPEIGKPLRYSLKGERTVYIKPYRLIYSVVNDMLVLLRFEHRKDVYG